jgi:hydrogenase expression/formation protein HypC
MCQAIPRIVLQINGDRVEVMYDGQPQWVTAHGIDDLAPGEYVVVYAGQALERMPKDEAEDILRFYDELEEMLRDAAER